MMLLLTLLGTALSLTVARCDEIVVQAGSMAVLPCSIESLPQAQLSVQWVKIYGSKQNAVWRIEQSGMEFRGMETIKRSWCPHQEFRKGSFNLHIERVKATDGGEYICKAMRGTKEVRRHILRVIQVVFTPAIPLEGSRVKVACNVSPWTKEVNVSWSHNGSPVPPQYPWRTRNITELQITSMSPLEMGNWTCTVRTGNKEGEATHHLPMRGISRPLAELAVVYGAVGSPVELPCVYAEGLSPQNTGWQRNPNGAGSFKPLGSSLQPPAPNSRPQWDRSLRLEQVEPGDAGIYQCFGVLEGRKLHRQLLLVTAQVRSAAPVKLNSPVTLTCDLSNTTGVTQYEWVQMTYDSNGTQTITPKHQTKTLMIPKMTEGHAGEWACRYHGKQGILGNVTYHLQVMSHLEGDKPEESSGKAAMVIGLSFLIIILLLIGLQMYKNHRRRKMILPFPALETIVHSASNARERNERDRVSEKQLCKQTQI
ncbi:hypothetical protein GJAV_G00006490 [Gymnothorax javanicus]|nr:hypothetical protein GJAV_G00006490 [Gymnothorax javanicus]